MNIKSVVIAGTTGTAFMTIFSYIVSATKDKNLKEPELLGELVKDLAPRLKDRYAEAVGWSIHYITGLVFAACFINEWEKDHNKENIFNGILIGAASGVIGAGLWKLVFSAHPAPPHTDYNKYYKHLVIAHAVFGMFAFLGYRSQKKLRQKA